MGRSGCLGGTCPRWPSVSLRASYHENSTNRLSANRICAFSAMAVRPRPLANSVLKSCRAARGYGRRNHPLARYGNQVHRCLRKHSQRCGKSSSGAERRSTSPPAPPRFVRRGIAASLRSLQRHTTARASSQREHALAVGGGNVQIGYPAGARNDRCSVAAAASAPARARIHERLLLCRMRVCIVGGCAGGQCARRGRQDQQ
jgi:hypothetical protein